MVEPPGVRLLDNLLVTEGPHMLRSLAPLLLWSFLLTACGDEPNRSPLARSQPASISDANDVPAELDRTDAKATAAAILKAFKEKDLTSVAALCTKSNQRLMTDLAEQGESHPRYKSIFSGWRWQAVSDWNGATGDVRYRGVKRAMVKFGDLGPDEVIVVTMDWKDDKWCFEDINSPDRAGFESESRVREPMLRSDIPRHAAPYETAALPHPVRYPGTLDGAKELLAQFLSPATDKAALTNELRPSTADFEAAFDKEFAEQAEKFYAELWNSRRNPAISGNREQTELKVWLVKGEDLRDWNGQAEAHFPGGYRRLGNRIQPGTVWVRWKFVEPGESLGMAYDGLVYVNKKWVWFPKPWRMLEERESGSQPAAAKAEPASPSESPESALTPYVATVRLACFRLGKDLGLLAIGRPQGLDERSVGDMLARCERVARAIELTFPPLPKLEGNETTDLALGLGYLLVDLKPMRRKLAASYGPEAEAVFDLAASCATLMLLYSDREERSETDAVLKRIERGAKAAALPETLTKPLLDAAAAHSTHDRIKDAVFKLFRTIGKHYDVPPRASTRDP
jgi:hypothetical protein